MGVYSGSTASLNNPYKFRAYRNAAWTTPSGTGLVTFDTKNYDTGTNYSTSTGKFTAPVAGFYQFNAGVSYTYTGQNYIGIVLYVNGSAYSVGNNIFGGGVGDTLTGFTVSDTIQLAASDYVQVYITAQGRAGNTGNTNVWFSGFLVSIN